MNKAVQTPNSRFRSRASLVLILSLFAAPVVIAWLLFFVFPDWSPEGATNYGQLIEPVQPLPEFEHQSISQETIDKRWFSGAWNFVSLQTGPCDEICIKQQFKVRQVRLSQGKNIGRLRRLLLWQAGGVSQEKQTELQEHFPGLVIVPLSAADMNAFVEVFSHAGEDPLHSGRLYLVDPSGFLMMSYESDDDPRAIFKDLRKLLKYSAQG